MPRHGFTRLRLVAASAVLAAGLTPLLPSTAVADTPQETVVPAALRSTNVTATLYGGPSYAGRDGAGAQGVFHSLEGSGLVWTRYADGTSVKVVYPAGMTSWSTTGGDVLAYRFADGRVDLWSPADDVTRTIRTPEGMTLLTVYADLAVAYRAVRDENGTTVGREMHLLSPRPDGTTRDVPVTGLPEGYVLGQPAGGDADGLLFGAGTTGGSYLSVMVDRRTGEVLSSTPPRAKPYANARVTAAHVVLFDVGDPVVQVFARHDLSAAPAEVTLADSSRSPATDLTVVGDWLVTRPGAETVAQPIAGGPRKALLSASHLHVVAGADGSALAIGRTAAAQDDWGIQRVLPGPDGSPVVTQVKALPKPLNRIQGLSLNQGRLVVAQDEYGATRTTLLRTVAATGTPTFGDSSRFLDTRNSIDHCPDDDAGCGAIHGMGDGEIAWLNRNAEAGYDRLWVAAQGSAVSASFKVPEGGRIADVSSRYLLYTTPDGQYVHRFRNASAPVLTRGPGVSALDGDTLWSVTPTAGAVVPYNLTTQKSGTAVTTDAGCTPTELQVLGRWLYWACDGRAGVYDRTAGRSVPVPADEAELGDGYVVTHDKRAGKLVLTTVANGTPASRVVGDLPDTGTSQRGVRWTVDDSGPDFAYVDDEQRVHLVPSGVPQQALRLLDPVDVASQVVGGQENSLARVLLSKPAGSWLLTVRDATGKVVDTRQGGPARGRLQVDWTGVSTGRGLLPNGRYSWALSVAPADGVGAPLGVAGSTQLLHGSPARHDFVGRPTGWVEPDGIGDLLTLHPLGRLTFHHGTGTGAFASEATGTGWPASVTPVPFGDLSGDGCNDVVVRLSSGALRLYKPACGAAPEATTPYTTLGTSGWKPFDVLASPGDVSGDGRPDLLARNATTGAVYLYPGTAAGRLASPVKLYANWKAYKKVVAAGDLNGDGVGDLLTQDRANNLYRFYGTGRGTFGPAVKVFAGWGSAYDTFVGVGDITGDGKADLVARDTAGGLYRIPGDGRGSFTARVKIGTGWQRYKGIF